LGSSTSASVVVSEGASESNAAPFFIGRIPLVLKDNFNTADMPTTGGNVGMKDSRPSADAFTVAKLRRAGALILGKANLQEFARGGMSKSSLGGQVLNPYDLTRTPGGSSGGAGASVAANLALAGTGSDTGQSIRSPSSANNLVGVRPTRGLVSRSGVIPNSQTQDEVGPIARTVTDAALLLTALAGFDAADSATRNLAGKAATEENKGDQDGTGGTDDPAEKKPSGPTREELAQKQADIAAEAASIQRAMDKINGISDLAKGRIAEGLKTAEQGAAALERGDSKEAEKAAEKASGMFRELAKNVEALAAAETSQKIAMARNMSEELSQNERDLAAELERRQESGSGPGDPPKKGDKSKAGQGDKPSDDPQKAKGAGPNGKEPNETPGGSGTGENKSDDAQENGGGAGRRNEKLAARADRIAESGKTIDDVLKAIARSSDPADKEAARQVQELMEQGKVGEIVKRLEAQAPALRAGKARETAAEAREMADRFEITAQKLETLHRSIVAPRIAELMQLERQAAELQEKLERLETPNQITNWHQGADELLEQLDKMGIAEEPREELYDAMKDAGWTANRVGGGWNWTVVKGYYGAPVVYHRTVKTIVSDLHAVIQELILGDLRNMGDETTPPQYERLVERYYQVLSTDK
jgi:hypothetical protein